MGKKQNEKKGYMDNRGSALVMVLVAVAFLGILSGVLMVGAYNGYKMRLTDKAGKDNFYTVETVLDEINVGLQQEISDALTVAYQDIMVNYALYETPEKRSERLYKVYCEELKKALWASPTQPDTYSIDLLRSYVSDELCGNGEGADGSRDHFGTYGAIVESNTEPATYTMAFATNGVILKDLKLTYVDTAGYVAMITTDIRIALPLVNFGQSAALPNLEEFCLVSNGKLSVGSAFTDATVTIAGNAYADSVQVGDLPGMVASGTTLEFALPGDESRQSTMVVCRGDLQVNKGALKTENAELWSGNILLNSGLAELYGNTNVKNDLKLNGDGSSVVLSGNYMGFGNSLTDPGYSSAILINGRNSSLDLSGLASINIGGHSYVGTAYKEGRPDAEQGNTGNVLMGESVAVKSNQLIYLVPPEAIGCEIEEDGTVGDSVYNTNPMTLAQYQELKNHPDKYLLINGDKKLPELGNKALNLYMNKENLAGGKTAYVPEVVFQQNAAGTTLVYCYMRFKDEEAANRYFRDYYRLNADKVDKYTRLYADAIKFADDENIAFLHLAGNALTYDEDGDGKVISATDSDEARDEADVNASSQNDVFYALTGKLVNSIAQLSVEEQGRTVYENLIDNEALTDMVTALAAAPSENFAQVTTPGGDVILCTGDYTVDDTTPEAVRMVICAGNLTVKRNFKGLLISGGEVLLCDYTRTSQLLEPLSLVEFTELMTGRVMKDGTEYAVLSVFRDGAGYTNRQNALADTGTKQVVLADLIVYERWSKE